MNIIKSLTPAALVVALAVTALPAAAQDRRGGDRSREERGSDRAVARDHGQSQRGSREAAPRQETRTVAPRAEQRPQAVPRQGPLPQQYRNDRRDNDRRDNDRRDGRDYNRYDGRDDNRYYGHSDNRYYGHSDNRYYGHGYVGPRIYIAPRVYHPYYFGRPYYDFRPRFSIGFGFWLGFPVAYPRAWISTYPVPVYGYYQGRVGIVPGAASYGGVSFDVQPGNAAIFLDGTFIGYAGDFAPNAAPLTLTPGPHHIEVQAEGYRAMTWDLDVIPGQVIPFRGAMQPY